VYNVSIVPYCWCCCLLAIRQNLGTGVKQVIIAPSGALIAALSLTRFARSVVGSLAVQI